MTRADAAMPATAPPFEEADLWAELLEVVARDVTGKATAHERMEIRRPDRLVPWLRALNMLRHDVEARTGDARLRLRALAKDEMGGDGKPTPVYLDAKAEFEEHNARRVRFRQGVVARQEECRFLLREYGLTARDGAAALDVMIQVLDLLDRDDVESARGLLGGYVRRVQGSPLR